MGRFEGQVRRIWYGGLCLSLGRSHSHCQGGKGENSSNSTPFRYKSRLLVPVKSWPALRYLEKPDSGWTVMARPRQCWAFSTSPHSSRRLAHIFRACGWSVSVHLERALTELFRELELTFVQQLVQAVNLLGNCLLLGKLVILGALLWFGFPHDGPCSQGAVTETLLMLVAT